MSWPNRRNIASMRALTRLAEQFSISLATCLQQTGVSIHQLNDPYAQVDATQELQLVTNLINAYGGYQPELGLQAGRYYHLDTYGIWGFALVSSPTLHEAIDLGLRYFDLTFAYYPNLNEAKQKNWNVLGNFSNSRKIGNYAGTLYDSKTMIFQNAPIDDADI